MSLTFQAVIAKLNEFWADRGCLVAQPYDTEKGAGTMSPHTFSRLSVVSSFFIRVLLRIQFLLTQLKLHERNLQS